VSQQAISTFVVSEPSEIVQALVGLKDVRVLYCERRGRQVDLVIEQVVTDPRCPGCGGGVRVKERPLVRYVDLPVYGTAMRLGCASTGCAARTQAARGGAGCWVIIGSRRGAAC
jgi:DNA-directed RNA polymerase subunit RPC12/RpoP